MASHSRFTDEIFCTPAPAAPQIDVRQGDEVSNEIFTMASYRQFQAGLIAAEEFKSKDLYETYPPQFKDNNKRLIIDLLNRNDKYLPSSNKSILVTRWKPFIPFIETEISTNTKVEFQADVFHYKPNGNSQTVEWYLNFANSDLFAYYGGALLAQDELQVLECIELGALREYFVQTVNSVGSRTVGSDAQTGMQVPTPILISNTERVIDLNTTEIYGNGFAKASAEQIQKAFQPVQPPQVVNLIAIEAPSYGEGLYTLEQIKYIVTTCYTGFKAAQILANKTHALNTGASTSNTRRGSQTGTNTFATTIHTGWWGCGAYGNNRQMMLIAQILAAKWAQIDRIIFHTQTKDYETDISAAEHVLQTLDGEKDVEEAIQKIFKLNLEWEKSNNT